MSDLPAIGTKELMPELWSSLLCHYLTDANATNVTIYIYIHGRLYKVSLLRLSSLTQNPSGTNSNSVFLPTHYPVPAMALPWDFKDD